LLAAALVAFALWRLGTAPPAVVPVESSARSQVDGAQDGAERTAGHHHRSHHGGVVGMVGDEHLEALALSSGRILVYLSDLGREPLPHDGLTGTATVYRDDDATELPLRVIDTATGQGMEAMAEPLDPGTVQVEFLLERSDGEHLSMEFYLPVGAAARRIGGAVRRCGEEIEPGEVGTPDPDRPLCTLEFDGAVTGLFALHVASHFVVSTTEARPSVWALPDVRLVSEFRALPQRLLEGRPMPVAARRVVAVRRGGREAVVTLPGTLVRYVLPGAVPFSLLPGTEHEATTAAWSSDAKRLVVAEPGGKTLLLINVVKGELVREVAVGAEITDLAFSESGRTAAVARVDGVVSLIDFLTNDHEPLLPEASGPLRSVAFSDSHVVAAGDDGVVRVWDVESRRMLAETSAGTRLTTVALAPDGLRVAVGGADGLVRVHDVSSLAAIATRHHHERAVTGIVWTSAGLVSGDAGGTVVIWPPAGG